MSDILIKGMEMPKERESFTVTIKYNGLVFDTETMIQVAKAVPVPPHGRCIDADELSAKLNMMLSMAFGEGNTAFHFAYRSLGKMVENAPTIIEAEEGE